VTKSTPGARLPFFSLATLPVAFAPEMAKPNYFSIAWHVPVTSRRDKVAKHGGIRNLIETEQVTGALRDFEAFKFLIIGFVTQRVQSDREHLLQNVQRRKQGIWIQLAEALCDPFYIHSPQLIDSDKTSTILETTSDTPRIRPSACRHRCNYYSSEMLIQFVR
jgi:hypothetical protein